MNGAPRKRHYYAEHDTKPTTDAVPPYTKKARLFAPSPSTSTRGVAPSSKRSYRDDAFERPAVANPESEEGEEDDDVERDRVAHALRQSIRAAEAPEEVDGVDDDEENEADDDGPLPLVVFQCSTCRSIFGDSYAFVCSTEQLWLVTNVTLNPEVQTATTGLDAGSSYDELLCQNCQAVLGRKYLTTAVALDNIRDLFSFSTEAITSYTLGDPMQAGEEEVVHMQHAAAACQSTMLKLAAERNEVARLRDEMEKVKGLMVTVDDRLACLEGADADSEEETTRQQRLPPPRA